MRLARATVSAGRNLQRRLPTLQRSTKAELLDQQDLDPATLSANLRDIRRVNRFFGGTVTVLHHLPALMESIPKAQTVTILDLATGSGDIPLALATWATQNGRSLAITASDFSPEILAIARRHVAGIPEITVAQHDARAVTEADASFDIVLCSLALHHFTPADAVRVLREMHRLARVGFIVNDLCRSRLGYAAAWIAAHATTRNRLTRHDAPLSVLRAYTPDELRDLLTEAGITDATIRTHAWFRMAAIARTDPAHA